MTIRFSNSPNLHISRFLRKTFVFLSIFSSWFLSFSLFLSRFLSLSDIYIYIKDQWKLTKMLIFLFLESVFTHQAKIISLVSEFLTCPTKTACYLCPLNVKAIFFGLLQPSDNPNFKEIIQACIVIDHTQGQFWLTLMLGLRHSRVFSLLSNAHSQPVESEGAYYPSRHLLGLGFFLMLTFSCQPPINFS